MVYQTKNHFKAARFMLRERRCGAEVNTGKTVIVSRHGTVEAVLTPNSLTIHKSIHPVFLRKLVRAWADGEALKNQDHISVQIPNRGTVAGNTIIIFGDGHAIAPTEP